MHLYQIVRKAVKERRDNLEGKIVRNVLMVRGLLFGSSKEGLDREEEIRVAMGLISKSYAIVEELDTVISDLKNSQRPSLR